MTDSDDYGGGGSIEGGTYLAGRGYVQNCKQPISLEYFHVL